MLDKVPALKTVYICLDSARDGCEENVEESLVSSESVNQRSTKKTDAYQTYDSTQACAE